MLTNLILLMILIISINLSWACSIFQVPETGQVAKNFDWHMPQGELMVRPLGAHKRALESNKTWISRYGSVTFNQFGPDLPIGGMNTKGLIVEALILTSTKTRQLNMNEMAQSLNESELIQYSLDNHANLEELLKDLPRLFIRPVHLPIHYFACDLNGCAVIEYLQGKLRVTTADDLKYPVLTNLAYSRLINAYEREIDLGTEGMASSARFNRLVSFPNIQGSEVDILSKLNSVKMGKFTAWQILYSPNELNITIKHPFSQKLVRVQMEKINFQCSPQLMVLSFEDKDDKFLEKNLSQKIFQRSGELKQIDPSTLKKLQNRKLLNYCSK